MKILSQLLFFFLLLTGRTWAKPDPDAVIYGAVPCLMGEECLKAVTAKLPYLRDLGVNIIWLAPIFETDDDSLISYSVTDFLKIRPDVGNEDDFRDLVRRAHGHGIRVIMDIVPNHTSTGHPWFHDEKKSDWYMRKPDGEHDWYFDWEHLPNLNYKKDEVRKKISEAFLYWIREFDVDGYRVDAAWGVRERAPDFWKPMNAQLRKEKDNLLLLAEASARDPFYLENGFDIAYDWTKTLGTWSWKNVFKDWRKSPARLVDALKAAPTQVARYINNNDTGERFITRHGLKLAKLAAVIQFGMPGTPVIYMGDEVGAEFDPYLDPPDLDFKDPHKLYPWYQDLIRQKKTCSDLHTDQWEALPSKEEGFLALKRGKGTLVLLNFSPAKKSFTWDNKTHSVNGTEGKIICSTQSL